MFLALLSAFLVNLSVDAFCLLMENHSFCERVLF
jgi:hypothetical protein